MAKEIPAKERRASKRASKSGSVVFFDGQQYPSRNLSVGGTLVEGYDGTLSAGSLLDVTGIGPAGDEQTTVLIRARINRVLPESNEIALQFLSLDDSAYEILQKIMTGRV
ncbi:MAG: PilZ domain-containing protein [Proteobacteria bacterium]|nr:PilZ domain-containing protein [Pseudomonadota bacterium]MDA1023147.1 PilZ domain-containing protein [Pseudomonadota bacterium]